MWSKKKFQHFVYSHVLLIIGILLVPFDHYYLYDLLIFALITWPLISLVQHSYFNHSYVTFKHKFVKWVMLGYLTIYSFWRFSDMKSYHITHHESWLTDQDPTAREVRQGWFKYYVGLTDPTPIREAIAEHDPDLDRFNNNFYLIKTVVSLLIILLLGIKWFIHLFLIQQFMMYFFSKLHDTVFHYKDTAENKPWLYFIYGADSWHIDHHRDFSKPKWSWDIQKIYKGILFNEKR